MVIGLATLLPSVQRGIDRRSLRPVIRAPAISGYVRLLAAISRQFPRGISGDEKKRAVDMSNTYADLQGFTGATGLEPATSGVTGRRSNQLNYAPRAHAL